MKTLILFCLVCLPAVSLSVSSAHSRPSERGGTSAEKKAANEAVKAARAEVRAAEAAIAAAASPEDAALWAQIQSGLAAAKASGDTAALSALKASEKAARELILGHASPELRDAYLLAQAGLDDAKVAKKEVKKPGSAAVEAAKDEVKAVRQRILDNASAGDKEALNLALLNLAQAGASGDLAALPVLADALDAARDRIMANASQEDTKALAAAKAAVKELKVALRTERRSRRRTTSASASVGYRIVGDQLIPDVGEGVAVTR